MSTWFYEVKQRTPCFVPGETTALLDFVEDPENASKLKAIIIREVETLTQNPVTSHKAVCKYRSRKPRLYIKTDDT